ncbi:DUF4335 domain-containing protein [Pleurocapsa sp. PCC 7319]|uniref:DUF4335 domain-containing protein n=1 Tax=Pleurocapsa sp. PCC 7319 TaxID=118161 RepID=UPI00034AFBD8|nr:DUF4335 domain-containing protein [Pleurocapsa sp. PCC 7319]
MNIKRQYSLPNCNLVLEGLEDADTESVAILDGHPPMSILINAECNFLNSNQKLSGGSVFLENLSQAVSKYAQGFLSGLSQPNQETTNYPQITLEKVIEQNLHRLTLEPEPGSEEQKIEVNLTTVELFDLVDAIDQFYGDRHTLPNMTLELRPISKRYRKPEQPLTERLTPVVLGFSSLAVMAGALFMIPPPEMREPKPASTDNTTETTPSTDPKELPSSEAEPIPTN